jgi:uncharacterized protein (DUF2147 family)
VLRAVFAALLICGGVFFTSSSAHADSPAGSWLTASGRAVVVIASCGADQICGHIGGVVLDSPGEPAPQDWRGQPQCGDLVISARAAADRPDQWHGTITDPRNGSIWHATLTLRDGTLYLRGYVGLPLFGQTQAWTPYTGHPPTGCRLTVG